jgi:hypothetical protein
VVNFVICVSLSLPLSPSLSLGRGGGGGKKAEVAPYTLKSLEPRA